jgi:hypothetical protein
MDDAAPTRLKLKLPNGEIEFEGSEALLKRLLPRLLRELTFSSHTAGNLQIKAELLNDVDELQQDLAVQDGIVAAMAQLFETVVALRERENGSLAQYFERVLQADTEGDGLLAATKQMQETQMSFNLQYLQLQSQMQNENRSYTAISNIMTTKHDTVKNSISNIR